MLRVWAFALGIGALGLWSFGALVGLVQVMALALRLEVSRPDNRNHSEEHLSIQQFHSRMSSYVRLQSHMVDSWLVQVPTIPTTSRHQHTTCRFCQFLNFRFRNTLNALNFRLRNSLNALNSSILKCNIPHHSYCLDYGAGQAVLAITRATVVNRHIPTNPFINPHYPSLFTSISYYPYIVY